MTDCLNEQGIVPGIKVDKGLVPLANSNGESWCMGLDGLDKRCAEYYKAGARFAKWRSVVSIPAGPSMIALRDCAYGLARYAAIAQNAGLVPIVEPEVLLDGDQDIDRWGLTCSTRVVAGCCSWHWISSMVLQVHHTLRLIAISCMWWSTFYLSRRHSW